MNIDFKVGEQLKAIREGKHMTQAYVSEGICSINSLVRIESNTQSPSFELLLALTNRMGISINMLIDSVNYSKNALYYSLKDSIQSSFDSFHWVKLKERINLLPQDVYDVLPVAEQQFIDIMKIEVATMVDKDFKYAQELGYASLAKTWNETRTKFYSPEELRLFNVIFRLDQSENQLNRVLKALTWIDQLPETMKDYEGLRALLTGLMAYHYLKNQWQDALQYAARGYDVTARKGNPGYMANFLFARGMCVYQMNIDQQKGLKDMRTALQTCLEFNMSTVYDGLAQDLNIYNVRLKDSY